MHYKHVVQNGGGGNFGESIVSEKNVDAFKLFIFTMIKWIWNLAG